jgi:hypothetical protein
MDDTLDRAHIGSRYPAPLSANPAAVRAELLCNLYGNRLAVPVPNLLLAEYLIRQRSCLCGLIKADREPAQIELIEHAIVLEAH